MQLSLRHWPDMRLTWVDGCAMVHAGPEPGAGMTSLVTKASGSTELAVVVTSHTLRLLPAMMNELADVLAERVPPRCTRIRLVAWNSGCLHDDRPAPAYQLATRLGIEVIAPAGPLLGVPGGSLFAAAGRGAQRPGGWWRFVPGSAPSRAGWRYPAPHWDADLAEVGDLGNGLLVEQVPAGLWLHRAGYRSVTDLVFSVPVDPDNPALIVSHPDEEPLRREELARALAALPRRTAERLIFTPYGPDPVSDGRLGEVAASVLGTPTRTRSGLPLYGAGGQQSLVTVDGEGRPRWRPFMRELHCNPRTEATEAADWINPAPDLLSEPIAPATFALGSGWAAEVIEAGLWIRPASASEPGDWARGLPLDVDECTIVVGTTSAAYPPPPGPLLAALLEQLPPDARKRVRLAVPRGAGEDVMSLAAALTERLPGDAELRVLAPGGRRRARMADPIGSTPTPALRQPMPYPPQPALREPTPYPPHPALREPTPYPPQPALREPASPAAHAAREVPPALREPTPYPPNPALREPTPYPPNPALREPTPYPPHPALREPTPYPPHPALREPTPYPPHPALREPTPYPPHPALREPTPYPPQQAEQSSRQPNHTVRPAGEPLFPPSTRPTRQPGIPSMTAPPGSQYPTPQSQMPQSQMPQSQMPPRPMMPSAGHAPVSPAPISPAPVPPPSHAARHPLPPPAPTSPAPFPPSAHPARQPGEAPTVPPRGAQQRPHGSYQPAPQQERVARQPMPPSPSPVGSPSAHAPSQPYPQPVRAARQPMPQPGQQPMPYPVPQPTPPPMPAVQEPSPERAIDDSQELLQRSEIRSHRTAAGKGGRGGGRDDDKATTSELNRLLGFFDEIRKARAWDEEPAGSRPSAS